MALQSLDIARRSATTTPAPGVRETTESRQAHRRFHLHRLQGLPGGVHGVERHPRRSRQLRRGVRQPDGPDGQVVDRDALFRGRTERQAGVADPQGRLHALRRSGLPQGLPGPRRDHPVRQRHRRFPSGKLHRLRLLHHRLSLQHPAHLARRTARPTSARCVPTGWPSARRRPASRPARPARSSSAARSR